MPHPTCEEEESSSSSNCESHASPARPSTHSNHTNRRTRGGTIKWNEVWNKLCVFCKKFWKWVCEQGPGVCFFVFVRILEISSEAGFLIPCVSATYLAPTPTPELRMFFFNLFMAFLFDMILVAIVEKFMGRPRTPRRQGNFMTLQIGHWSFRSIGHSTRPMMVASHFWLYLPMWKVQAAIVWVPFLTRILGDYIIILEQTIPIAQYFLISLLAWIITTWAIATTSVRIMLGKHFMSDIMAGAVLGIFESIFTHYFLFIPCETSELLHLYINTFFSWIHHSVGELLFGKSFTVQQLTPRWLTTHSTLEKWGFLPWYFELSRNIWGLTSYFECREECDPPHG